MADKQPPPSLKHPPSVKNPPAITLPPRSGIDLFTGGAGASPGPMTLVSSFFAENDPETDCRSFSQLLAVDGGGGATTTSSTVKEYSVTADADSSGGTGGFTFQQRGAQTVSRPQEMVAIPTGMSLSNYLDSGVFFNPSSQAAFGGMNQGVTGNEDSISESQVENKFQAPYPSFSAAAAPNLQQQIATPMQELKLLKEPYDVSAGADPRQRTSNLVVDKPSDDGYNWRKYGQKQVKGGDFPRSYYKCTHASCPVKKKVERSLDGQITEIIYRGQHNHSPPSKRNRDTGNAAAEAVANPPGNSGFRSESLPGGFNKLNGEATYSSSLRDQDPCQATPERLSGSNDSDEVDDSETRANERSSEPESKRRIVEAQGSSHRTVTEPRIVVQTTSEVDLLDDGYRWRKYGQKVVKGNPNPRSYYKCSHPGCSIRKHVERAATDPKAVITTYEGKHNHDAPTSKNSSNMQSLHSRQHSDFK